MNLSSDTWQGIVIFPRLKTALWRIGAVVIVPPRRNKKQFESRQAKLKYKIYCNTYLLKVAERKKYFVKGQIVEDWIPSKVNNLNKMFHSIKKLKNIVPERRGVEAIVSANDQKIVGSNLVRV
jgi:hypothetical protein